MQGWQLAGLCTDQFVTGICEIAGLRTQSKLAGVRPGAGHSGWQHASEITPSPSSRKVEHNSWNKDKHYGDKGGKRRARIEKGGLGGAGRLREGRRKMGGGLQATPAQALGSQGLVIISFVVIVIFFLIPAKTLFELLEEGPVIA